MLDHHQRASIQARIINHGLNSALVKSGRPWSDARIIRRRVLARSKRPLNGPLAGNLFAPSISVVEGLCSMIRLAPCAPVAVRGVDGIVPSRIARFANALKVYAVHKLPGC